MSEETGYGATRGEWGGVNHERRELHKKAGRYFNHGDTEARRSMCRAIATSPGPATPIPNFSRAFRT